jgi:hypothetical protein
LRQSCRSPGGSGSGRDEDEDRQRPGGHGSASLGMGLGCRRTTAELVPDADPGVERAAMQAGCFRSRGVKLGPLAATDGPPGVGNVGRAVMGIEGPPDDPVLKID